MPNDCCADGDLEIRPHLPMISLSLSLVLNVIYFYKVIPRLCFETEQYRHVTFPLLS